jgi:hypothetical protein
VADHPMDRDKGKSERDFNRAADPLRARKGDAQRAFNKAAKPPEENPSGPQSNYDPPAPGFGSSAMGPQHVKQPDPQRTTAAETPQRSNPGRSDPLLARKGQTQQAFDKAARPNRTPSAPERKPEAPKPGFGSSAPRQEPSKQGSPEKSPTQTPQRNSLKAAFDKAKNKNRAKQAFNTRSKLP